MTLGIETDNLDVIDELSQMEHDYVSMESIIKNLDGLSQRISLEGIGRQDATTIMAYGDNILPGRYPLNSFTQLPSKTNLVPALEGIFSKTQEILWKIFESIAEFITKVVDWFKDRLTGAKTARDLQKDTEAWRKATEERIKAMEQCIAELERNKDLSAAEKVEARQNIEAVMSNNNAQQQEERRRRDEAYTQMVKACLYHPDKIIFILDSLSTFPVLRDNISNTIRTIEATLNLYDKKPSIESLMTALGATNDLTNRFNDKLDQICVKLNRCRIPLIQFGYYDPDAPDEFLASVRNAIVTASRTPSGEHFATDFKPGHQVASNTIHQIGVASEKVEKFIDKNDTLGKDLTELSKRLRVTIKRIRNLSIEPTTEQVEIRNKLLDVSRLLRRSLFAYMRLRDVPLTIIHKLAHFAAIERETEETKKALFG